MQLMEIEDPVEDQAGYVYERYIVEKYIKENQGSVECPVSGKNIKCLHVCSLSWHGQEYECVVSMV